MVNTSQSEQKRHVAMLPECLLMVSVWEIVEAVCYYPPASKASVFISVKIQKSDWQEQQLRL